ncbi:hypothetical protein TGDOM2_265990 [Toxoplasma gondii GAB2-2007-GAL-DOM2]|uniref:Uncharacterized protein n=7 Tax=Toxoplasma gondii TaxID=5811 RepID=B9Q1B6_TOXGV|nr:hypothetical protein TGGT1_265990 [Toxoplasma gondii GT1]ESS33539.1 hypothetical protein TGVEG_265990 [Toxoplasma gondii VEG]KAF4644189.1 hypothetical protein TGRH88_011810 [Toxoplasma gondii]KFG38624.1 hypothetical protein TGDOM2_265990 [Toxoplasma gondii GAB2-2007-GAL-DOM2]RQX74047.1 hypothetical protein TGCAST_265990 [Toxoplasma gondii CAST]
MKARAKARGAAPAADGSPAEDGKKVLSENVRRLRFMQGKSASGHCAANSQGASSQRLFHQHQLKLLQQQQKQFCQLQKPQESSRKDPREGASLGVSASPAEQDVAGSARPPSAASATQSAEEKSRQIEQLNELRKHWCAPGWECAEDIYAIQQQDDMQMLLHIGHPSLEAKRRAAALVLSRRAYGGTNPFVESNMRRIERKVLQLERRQEEEKEAKRWKAVHSGRQNVSVL